MDDWGIDVTLKDQTTEIYFFGVIKLILKDSKPIAIAHVILRAWATGEGEVPQPRM